jgi:hypothetical protein
LRIKEEGALQCFEKVQKKEVGLSLAKEQTISLNNVDKKTEDLVTYQYYR